MALGTRDLNRSLLARQGLLERRPASALEWIERLVGMQAQNPLDPYLALWSRIEDFHPDELAGLMLERQAVRVSSMRTTIHLFSADDALVMRPLTQGILARTFWTSQWGKRLRASGLDVEPVLAAGREILAERPLTSGALGRELSTRWPDEQPDALAMAVRFMLPVVQVPPRGVWGRSAAATLAPLETFVGRSLDAAPTMDSFMWRYLAAFGPATPADIRAWCGITGLREAVERVRPRLVTVRTDDNRELLDIPDAPYPAPDTPAPVRFLPEYDNIFIGHADRRRITSDPSVYSLADVGLGRPILIDGFITGTWRLVRDRKRATLLVQVPASLAVADRAAVLEEAERVATFLTPEATERDIQLGERP